MSGKCPIRMVRALFLPIHPMRHCHKRQVRRCFTTAIKAAIQFVALRDLTSPPPVGTSTVVILTTN